MQFDKQKKEDSETRKINDLTEVAKDIFNRKSSLTMAELTHAIMDVMDVKDRMARNNIKYMKEHSIIEKNPTNSAELRLIGMPF